MADNNAPIETKVKAGAGGATVAALIALIILHFVPWLNGSGELLHDAIAAIIGGVIGGIGSFAAGYQARHTPRAITPPSGR
jgi:hypothetical protein